MYKSILYVVIAINAAFGVLLHEPSMIEIKPPEDIERMAFGFSMGYQKSGKLVIGAPNSDLDGRVYTCSIKDILKDNNVCQKANIDVEGLTEYSTRGNPDCHYYLGASIAATDDYFLTCAPFWTSSYHKIDDSKFGRISASSYGTCFVYNETAYLFNGPYEQFMKDGVNSRSFGNGLGWTTLYDQSNSMILLSKIFDKGYISYISSTDPLKPSWSTESNPPRSFLEHVNLYRNVGSALASGTFFYSGKNQTMYAFSMQSNDMYGKILFLRYNNKKLFVVRDVSINSEMINTMFGSTMLGADMNLDGYSELLVGAPAFYEDDAYETGALYIYTGGDLPSIGSINRTRLIVGNKVGARFGSAIASTDVDGDGFPEVIVSAPYEDDGIGAVYIISGKEFNKKCLKDVLKRSIPLSQLVSTQRIQNTDYRSFGVTLQVIKDVNNNGADELAVGCPESSRVVMYRGVPSVHVTVSSHLVGDQVVRIKANSFTVRVIINITLHENPLDINGELLVVNSVVGNGVQIRSGQEMTSIVLSRANTECVTDVDVDMINDDPGTYKFTTSVSLKGGDMIQSDVFNPSWVAIYPENPTSSLEIERRCSGESCLPQLNMTLEWSGSKPITLGSETTQEVIMRFKNYGHISYVQTCVHLKISGGRFGRNACEVQDGLYKCLLPLPIKRNAEHLITIPIDMSEPTNDVSNLVVDARFYNSSCGMQSDYQESRLIIPLEVDTGDIAVSGESWDRVVTDSDVLDETVDRFEDAHQYTIVNNGSVLWKDVRAVIKWKNQTTVENFKIPQTSIWSNCDRISSSGEVTYTCIINLEPNSAFKFIVSTVIKEENVEKDVVGDSLNISSTLQLYLLPTEVRKELTLTTVIQYRKELSLGQKKPLIVTIAVIVALLILALVVYILRKIGFFNRDTKKKLKEEKKEDALRRSMKRPAVIGPNDNNMGEASTGIQNDGIEVVEGPLKGESREIDVCEQDSLITTREVEVH